MAFPIIGCFQNQTNSRGEKFFRSRIFSEDSGAKGRRENFSIDWMVFARCGCVCVRGVSVDRSRRLHPPSRAAPRRPDAVVRNAPDGPIDPARTYRILPHCTLIDRLLPDGATHNRKKFGAAALSECARRPRGNAPEIRIPRRTISNSAQDSTWRTC